jgi:hypothetical protein
MAHMRYRLSTLMMVVTGSAVLFGLIRAELFVPLLFIAGVIAVYLVANLALAYLIASGISAFNWLIGRLQGKP